MLFVDYLNFVKKCMKQLQSEYFVLLRRIDVELTPLDSTQEQIIPGTLITVQCKHARGTLPFKYAFVSPETILFCMPTLPPHRCPPFIIFPDIIIINALIVAAAVTVCHTILRYDFTSVSEMKESAAQEMASAPGINTEALTESDCQTLCHVVTISVPHLREPRIISLYHFVPSLR